MSDLGWIAFTPASAPWVPMKVDHALENLWVREQVDDSSIERVENWIRRAESALYQWIMSTIVQSEKRAIQFRQLGRGWIFVQLSSTGSSVKDPKRRLFNRSRFKWWFENVDSILANRSEEVLQMGLDSSNLEGWTQGYLPSRELVFVLRGIRPGRWSFSVQQIRSDWRNSSMWVNSSELESELQKPVRTDEERVVHAEMVRERNRKKRAAQKVRKKIRAQEQATAGEAADLIAGKEAALNFESLLQEMQLEDAAERASDHSK